MRRWNGRALMRRQARLWRWVWPRRSSGRSRRYRAMAIVRLPETSGDATMQSFDDVLFPLALGRDASVTPEFSTNVTITASGFERRNSLWSDARLRFDVGPGVRSEAELGELIGFFRGAAWAGARVPPARSIGFQFERDDGDADTSRSGDRVGGMARRRGFELVKLYGDDEDAQRRRITRPRGGTVRVSVNGCGDG
jgi:uncharacterized protein (TIGR02217 family)